MLTYLSDSFTSSPTAASVTSSIWQWHRNFAEKATAQPSLPKSAPRIPSNRIILEIDDVSVKSADAPTRIRRKAFYLRNGYAENSVHIRMYGQPMEVLSQGGPITRPEYLALWKSLMQFFSGRTAVDAYLHEMFG
jgi:hypothetical protein